MASRDSKQGRTFDQSQPKKPTEHAKTREKRSLTTQSFQKLQTVKQKTI